MHRPLLICCLCLTRFEIYCNTWHLLCNPPQHTATASQLHCNTLQLYCNSAQTTADILTIMDAVCNILHYTATHCTTLQHTTTQCNILQHTAAYCKTLRLACTFFLYLHARTCTPTDTHSLAATCAHTYEHTHTHTHTHTRTHTHSHTHKHTLLKISNKYGTHSLFLSIACVLTFSVCLSLSLTHIQYLGTSKNCCY